MSEWRDVGHGVRIRTWIARGCDPLTAEATEEVVGRGMVYEHLRPDNGEVCLGSIAFSDGKGDDMDRGGWTVESEEPLTLSPSLRCTICGHHGFVRDGKWVPA